MAITWTEHRSSRSSTHTPPSEMRVYTLRGTTDETYARTWALQATPQILAHPAGAIYRQDVAVIKDGHAIWRVNVPYGPRQIELGEFRLSFDTSGGTVRITNSLATAAKYSRPGQAAAPDMGGAIGVRGDQIDGVDVVIPALKVTASFTHPAAVVTLPHIKTLARITGQVNSTAFLTFAPGEVLFLGATGDEGTSTQTQVAYQFLMSENATGLTIGDIVDIVKAGHDYAWIRYEDAAISGQPAKRPRHVYVEQVYKRVNLAAVLGFGG